MKDNIRRLSSGIYALIILCFFLPFASLSSQGKTMAKISGIQLVTGNTVEGTKISPEALAIIVFTLAVLGLSLSFLRFNDSELFAAIAGAVGFVLTIILKSGIENDLARQSYGVFEVDSEIGYLVMLLLFLTAMGVNGYNWKYRKLARAGGVKLCSTCGKQNPTTNDSCPRCGSKLNN